MTEKRRLLVVDDDIDFADSLGDLLDAEGFEVSIAYSGEDAVGMMRTQPFDLTLMDVQMPGQSGVDSLMAIRQFEPSAKVVMMTGYSVSSMLDRAVEAGAWAVLHKPLDLSRLLRLVETGSAAPVVLVADDDADFVDSLQGLLETSGYAVMIARDGAEVVQRVRRRAPDILLLDLRMPDVSGLTAYAELDELGIRPPTIIISAYIDDEREAIERFDSLPPNRIFSKPIETDSLLRLMRSLTTAH